MNSASLWRSRSTSLLWPKSIFAIAAISLLGLAPITALGQTPASIKELSKRTVTMPPVKNCKALGICDLKGAMLVERKVKVLLADERSDFASYMTDMRFIVEVTKPASIPNYGIVQFMKGCMYGSELMPNGTEQKEFSYVHRHFGSYKLIKHDNWVIDSEHADPVSTSFEKYGRFDLYKWNTDPKNLDADNATWYFDAKPPHGTVFKADLVANTGLIEDSATPKARNSSLDLETCIFKIADLPKTTDETGVGVDKSKALWCASWDHKFHYDFATSTVIQDKAVDPFCATPSTGPL